MSSATRAPCTTRSAAPAADFDMCGRPVRPASIDAGGSFAFPDTAGQGCLRWNARGFRFRAEI